MSCPGVYDLEDGRALVVGKHVTAKDLSDFAHAGGFLIADDERGVIVPRELLKGL
jgi:hypothetical protein